MAKVEPIIVVSKRLPPSDLARFIGRPFPGMVKFVVDVERKIVALGGELHVDAEAVLLARDSQQESLWGGNYYPGLGQGECIEHSSLINIRPAQGNRLMEIQDTVLREKIALIVFDLIGRGEALP